MQTNIFILIINFSALEHTDNISKNDCNNSLTTEDSLMQIFQMVFLMIIIAS